MIYKHLDSWDVQRIKDNINDIDTLLDFIDKCCDVTFDKGYDDGYIDGYIQSRRDNEEEQQ